MLTVAAALPAGPVQAASTDRVSISSAEAQANDVSTWPSVSADGRFVAFHSFATNLVAGDTNGHDDIFVRDRLTGATERVSGNATFPYQGSVTGSPSISGDGRYVAFSSRDNLVAGDTGITTDVFVRDRATGTTEKVSIDGEGVHGDNRSELPSISADGRYVAFLSLASNLVPGDTNFNWDAYVKDRLTGNIERVSLDSSGAQIGACSDAKISGDGRFVVFITSQGIVPGDTNGTYDVFIRDRIALTTTRVSVGNGGVQANGASLYPAINADGRFVAFYTGATNLVAGDTNGASDVFVRDRQTGKTERVSVTSSETQTGGGGIGFVLPSWPSPSISADGRFVVFDSFASDLVAGDTNADSDVFVRDRQAGTTSRVSVTSAGAEANNQSYSYDVSADGRFVAFISDATNLVAGDTNAVTDIFLRDRSAAQNDLLVDFGANGLYQRMNDRTWLKVHNSSPIFIAAGDLDGSFQDEAIGSFGGLGLYARYNNASPWVKLHNTAAARFVADDLDGNGRDEIIVDLGATGIFARYNNAGAFVRLHTSTSQQLAVGDLEGNGKVDLLADLSTGLWVRRNNISTWVRLHATSPATVATGDLDGNGKDEVIGSFGGLGVLALYNNAGAWVRLHGWTAQGFAAGDLDGNGKEDLLVDFGASGLYARYNNVAPWVKLHASNPTRILATDLDNNGKGEVIASFPGTGLYVRRNNAGAWVRLHSWVEQGMAAGGFD